MDNLFNKDAEGEVDNVLDKPLEPSNNKPVKDPQNPLQVAEYILTAIATARVGYKVFSYYAIRFQLKDNHWILFRIFLIIAYFIDISLAIMVISITISLLIGLTYVILTGLNAYEEVQHILIVIIDGIKQIF